jgi:MFS family permease
MLSPILYTLTAFGPVALMERYGLSESEAGRATSLLYCAIVLSPLFGVAIDRVGYRSLWQVCAAATIPVLLALGEVTDLSPYVIMGGLGVAYAVTETNGLAMVAVVVPSASLGTAYGLLGCGISIALLFEPYGVGLIKQSTGSYNGSTIMFVVVSAAGALLALGVYLYDKRRGRIMCHAAPTAVAAPEDCQ